MDFIFKILRFCKTGYYTQYICLIQNFLLIIKHFMSMGIKVLYDWILKSNRPAHVKAGMFVFVVMLAFCFLLLGISFCQSAIVSLVTTVIAALVVEYIQKKCGYVFDWLDALATVLLPGLITVFSILIALTL